MTEASTDKRCATLYTQLERRGCITLTRFDRRPFTRWMREHAIDRDSLSIRTLASGDIRVMVK